MRAIPCAMGIFPALWTSLRFTWMCRPCSSSQAGRPSMALWRSSRSSQFAWRTSSPSLTTVEHGGEGASAWRNQRRNQMRNLSGKIYHTSLYSCSYSNKVFTPHYQGRNRLLLQIELLCRKLTPHCLKCFSGILDLN